MNPARVQAKHDVDQWSNKQRRRPERKYILIGQPTQGVSSTFQGRKGNILYILGQTLDVLEALHWPGDII